jgi:hypothetical protein
MERLPVAPPLACGSKFTETVTDWLGVRVMLDPPLALNPFPVAFTLVMVTFAVPESVSVTSCAVDVPRVTFPKLTPVELGSREDFGVTPEPDPPPVEPPLPAGALTTPQALVTASATKASVAARMPTHGLRVLKAVFIGI